MKPQSAVVALLAGLASAVLAAQAPPPAPPKTADYVVHEWGTFTSMVGQEGIALEGLHHEEEALPKFVHDLLKVDEFEATDGKLPASRVTQKMETPVLYFYADAPLRAQVGVWFHQGLISQFYPLPETVYPLLDDSRKQRLDMSKVDGSSLQWDIELIPHGATPPAGIPVVAADEPWAFARQTSACYVRTVPGQGSPAKPEAEHYLFYRGLGRWTPPMKLSSLTGGKVSVQNGMKAAVPFVAVLELGEQGGRCRVGAAMPAQGQQAFDLGTTPWNKDRAAVSRELGAHVLQALTAQGLFPDEARAMVATWTRSWFQKDGARVLYVLPRQLIDEVLPLSLVPAPKQLVRVLVGRLEYITPETQAKVEAALRQQAGTDQQLRATAMATLRGLDRFLEPHLRQIAERGAADVRPAAVAMLAHLPR
jgi:hypothetical protein